MASLQEARRERDEAVARMAEEDEDACNHENRGGIVQSIEESTKSLLGAVTGATKDKTEEVSDKARETKDAATEKAGEMKDRMEETKERASKSKDRNTAKMMDYEDASEEKRSSSEKLGEYKESAAEAARKAREFLVEGKEEARIKLAGKPKDRKKQLEDVKHRAAEKAKEDRRKLNEPDEGDDMTELIKEKMTLPEDIVAHKRGQYGGGDDVRDDKMRERESRDEEDIMLRMKDADQMTGMSSTDTGKLGGEGMA